VVLPLFWGAFTCIAKISGKSPWLLSPTLAMICYGLVFHMGFFNFYLSLAFCLWAFVAALSRTIRLRWLAAPLLLTACLAHLFPPAWALCVGIYFWLAARQYPRLRWALFGLGVAGLIGVRLFLEFAYIPRTYSRNFVSFGPDQFFLYGVKYALPAILTMLVWGWLLIRRLQARSTWSDGSFAVFSLLAISALAVVILPSELAYANGGAPFGYIPERLSLMIALQILAFINEGVVPRWAVGCLTISAMSFFLFMWKDATALDRLENETRKTVRQLPSGTRVISALCDASMRNITLLVLDRACIGHCFSYANYEPSTRQFAVKASTINPFVMHRHSDVAAVEAGTYAVQESDLPLYQVGLCSPDSNKVCATRLKAGQRAVRRCSQLVPKL
jgi:hypothetical protein